CYTRTRLLAHALPDTNSHSSSHPPLLFPHYSGHHRALHSFPTRRSSDLASSLKHHRSSREPPPRARMMASKPWRSASCRASMPSDRKSTRLNSSHVKISYAVFCLKKKRRYHTCKSYI